MASMLAAPLVAAIFGVPESAPFMLDAFMAGDELDMLRYRLLAQSPIVRRVIVLESNATPAFESKPWYVSEALTTGEVSRYNVRIVRVPIVLGNKVTTSTRKEHRSTRVYLSNSSQLNNSRSHARSKGHSPEEKGYYLRHHTVTHSHTTTARTIHCVAEDQTSGIWTYLSPRSQDSLLRFSKTFEDDALLAAKFLVNHVVRTALNLAILEELNTMGTTRNSTLVYVSDIDEIMDPSLSLQGYRQVLSGGCVVPRQRVLVYSERCAFGLMWTRSMLFDARKLHRGLLVAPWRYLRGHHQQSHIPHYKKVAECPTSSFFLGWHLTYFMPSQQMALKLQAWGDDLMYKNARLRLLVNGVQIRGGAGDPATDGREHARQGAQAGANASAVAMFDGWASRCHCLYGGQIRDETSNCTTTGATGATTKVRRSFLTKNSICATCRRHFAAHDAVLPPRLDALPRHPNGPTAESFSLKELQDELDEHERTYKSILATGHFAQAAAQSAQRVAMVKTEIKRRRADSV